MRSQGRPARPSSRTSSYKHDIIDTVNKVVRTSRRMLPELGQKPTPEEIAERLAMPLEKLRRVLEFAKRPIHLETATGKEPG